MNYGKPSFLGSIPPVVKNLIFINFILWLITVTLPTILGSRGIDVDLRDILGMHYWASEKFNIAQMITYMFMHGGFTHIFFNMFALFMFGGVLEQYWGQKRFLFYYLVTGAGAGIVQQLFWMFEFQPLFNAMNETISSGSLESIALYQAELSKYFRISDFNALRISDIVDMKQMLLDQPVTVGASGSVFGLLLAFGWLFPQAKMMLIFLPIPIPARIFVALYGLAELFLGVANFSGDSVAHFAHLGGMLFGAILILYWKKKDKRF